MITGVVTADRETIVQITLLDASGNEHCCNAVIDTGYTGSLTLPTDLIEVLGLQWRERGGGTLADGNVVLFDVYTATVIWDGEPRTIPIYEMDAEPLVGMSLMYGFELNMPILDGSPFTLRRLTEQ